MLAHQSSSLRAWWSGQSGARKRETENQGIGVIVKKILPLAASSWGQEEIAALHSVIESGQYSMGARVREFESRFAEFHGSRHSVMSNSGSSANLLMLSALRYDSRHLLSPGDEIIAPAVSWSTTYYPINQVGAKIRLVDVDPGTLSLNVSAVERAITNRTKAILAVNLLGNPAHLDRLSSLADSAGLVLLEDNCESLGASLNGKKAGAFGLMGSHSFFFSHHMSTMEGGSVLTHDSDLRDVLASLRAHGWTRALPEHSVLRHGSTSEWNGFFEFVLPGYNLRPLEMSGALGLTQLEKLAEFIEMRRKNARHWQDLSSKLPNIRIQRENGNSSWFGFSMVLEGRLRGRREELVERLDSIGVESRPIVAGNIMRHRVAKHLDIVGETDFPVADEIHDHGLFIGNHHFPVSSALDRVAEVVVGL